MRTAGPPRCRDAALRGGSSTSGGPAGQQWWIRSAAGAEQVLGRELLEPDEVEATAVVVGVGVEVRPGGAVGEELVVALAVVQRRLRELGEARGGEGLLDLGVGSEGG